MQEVAEVDTKGVLPELPRAVVAQDRAVPHIPPMEPTLSVAVVVVLHILEHITGEELEDPVLLLSGISPPAEQPLPSPHSPSTKTTSASRIV
jgi:hypothetical protein